MFKWSLLLLVIVDTGTVSDQLTSLSVGHSQTNGRDGGISDIAVKLQKFCIFLPGCFNHWYCDETERERSS